MRKGSDERPFRLKDFLIVARVCTECVTHKDWGLKKYNFVFFLSAFESRSDQSQSALRKHYNQP